MTEELNRIKGYMGKLKEANGSAHKEQQRLKLNKDAVRDWLSCVSIVHVCFLILSRCCSGLLMRLGVIVMLFPTQISNFITRRAV